jgi:hypothetical protein
MWDKLWELFRTKSGRESDAKNFVHGVGFYLCLFSVSFYCLLNFLQTFLKRTTVLRRYQRHQFAHLTFTLTFHASSAVFLVTKQNLQHSVDERPLLSHAAFLFQRTCESAEVFHTVTVILVSFFLFYLFVDMFDANPLGFVMKLLYIVVLVYCYRCRLENLSTALNIRLAAFYVISKLTTLVALVSNRKKRVWIRFLATLKLCVWSFCFLNVVPIRYLLPAIQSPLNGNQWLVVVLGLWYTSAIWNSPILKYFYHQLYHVGQEDCVGRDSVSRCVLLRDSEERRHLLLLQESVIKINLLFK